MSCRYLDAEGKSRPVIMGCYGIGVSPHGRGQHRAKPRRQRDHLAAANRAVLAHLIGLNLEDEAVNREATRFMSA